MEPMLPAVEPIPRYELDAPVLSHERTADNAFEIVFHAPQIAEVAQPGQFLELLFGDNYAPLVRRPFSLYRVDRAAGTFSVLYRAHGSFTSGLMHKQAGDSVSVLGPLGQPYRWSAESLVRPILIAGGIGAPPLCFLATEMCRAFDAIGRDTRPIIVLNAARSADLLIGMPTFESLDIELITVTDDGSHGTRGVAPEVLTVLLDAPDTPASCVFACGPMPMLRALGSVAMARSLPCQVSVETSMPCGIGTCWGCAIPLGDAAAPDGFTYARACYEGPVFEAASLLWNVGG